MCISKTTWFKKKKEKQSVYLCVDSRLSSSWTSDKFWLLKFKWKLCLSLRLWDEAVRCNSETVVRASMHLCPSHLRNTSTSDTVILFCPVKPLMLQDVAESPPLFHCAVPNAGDWSLNQTVACVYFPPVQVSSIAPPYRGIWGSTVCLGQGTAQNLKL